MEDFNGKELAIGDKVVYLVNVRTGSSTIRKCLYRGTVIRFTPCKVGISCELGYSELVYPQDVIKVDW